MSPIPDQVQKFGLRLSLILLTLKLVLMYIVSFQAIEELQIMLSLIDNFCLMVILGILLESPSASVGVKEER